MKARGRIARADRPTVLAASNDTIQVRHCHGAEEFNACIAVERAVWKSADIDVVPLPMFVVAVETGGHVLGAFDGSKVIGFTLAFSGWRDRQPLLHSHMTAVLEKYRDRSIARRLKMFQRDDALARGISRVEWTFDPLQRKNAHFNLMTLGAVVRRYLPNVYGITTSPLHASLPTDRLLAEWDLRSSRVRAGLRPTPSKSKRAARISVPAALETLKRSDPEQAASLQAKVRKDFLGCFAQNYVVTAVEAPSGGESGGSAMTYILEPASVLRRGSSQKRHEN